MILCEKLFDSEWVIFLLRVSDCGNSLPTPTLNQCCQPRHKMILSNSLQSTPLQRKQLSSKLIPHHPIIGSCTRADVYLRTNLTFWFQLRTNEDRCRQRPIDTLQSSLEPGNRAEIPGHFSTMHSTNWPTFVRISSDSVCTDVGQLFGSDSSEDGNTALNMGRAWRWVNKQLISYGPIKFAVGQHCLTKLAWTSTMS